MTSERSNCPFKNNNGSSSRVERRCFNSNCCIRTEEFLFHLRSSKERHGKLFIDGKDVFARLSTGFLKSLIFQLAPLVAALSYRCSDWLKVLTMICISGASI